MTSALLKPRGLVSQHRGLLAGLVLGGAIVMTTLAVAQSNTNWFAGLFSTGGASSGAADTTLISQQDSVVATEINSDAASCAQGAAGTVGAAIQTATKAHTTLASATPQTSSLFDPSGPNFSSISQIFDLSFAIPSLASIVGAADSALAQYAKRTWNANSQITSLVTTPINQAISDINAVAGFSDINGMSGSGMLQIDPAVGAQYQNTTAGGAYSVNTNPFNSAQTTFTSGSSGTNAGQLNSTAAQVSTLTQEIGNQQIAVNQDQTTMQNAQTAYNTCMGSGGSCASELSAVQAAQSALVNDQTTLISLQEQLSQLVAQGASGPTTGTTPVISPPAAQPQMKRAAPPASGAGNEGFWSGVSKLFN